MARIILMLLVPVILIACSQNQDDATARLLAERTAELETAREGQTFWQTTATVLGSLTILALVIGAALGSKAKDDADEK